MNSAYCINSEVRAACCPTAW